MEAKGYNGQIVIDGEWLEINRRGGLALLSQGLKGSKRIPLANITSVQLKGASALTNGYIQFSLLGSAETKGGLFDATSDENSVVFRKPHQEQFDKAGGPSKSRDPNVRRI
jgi:Domain of unknown function (DUF4429)